MESDLYGQLMVEATRLHNRLWRNNVGMARYTSDSGEVYTVPYGLGGKDSADVIGFTKRGVYEFYVGRAPNMIIVAIFTALEVKDPNAEKKENRAARDRRERQKKYLEFVRNSGGIAGIVTCIADYHQLIGHTE